MLRSGLIKTINCRILMKHTLDYVRSYPHIILLCYSCYGKMKLVIRKYHNRITRGDYCKCDMMCNDIARYSCYI